MRSRVVYSDFSAHMKTWYRSKGTMFWSLVFPIMLMALFGAIFGAMFDRQITLHVQDRDQTDYTTQLIEGLSIALEVKIIPPEVDIREYITEKGLRAALQIPGDFTNDILASMAGGENTTHIDLYLDPSQGQVNEQLKGII
ncbi:MAG: ABC transporter permease, partial [Theionarchaea archaeon]|nr:ABC transporter permease [Theionarchaea archaeon]